ncbi:hypothetical protein [Kineococcus rhizosphaerae]|uniref:Uncharacterized protein n=1 Tax=Kineococcus rhizosphaerae TaxID=559628 RepID=A0A2T0R9J8_9ACTN|nr:hypothetical protein [Kineococcus rhizosphaerae]PRY17842.1 hypothetical protein CLV37_10179 [Kineococcus rhizosphaerae]
MTEVVLFHPAQGLAAGVRSPADLALQVHAVADDPDGDAHLVVDDSPPGHDEAAAAQSLDRLPAFLADR